MSVMPIIQIGVDDQTGQLVLNTESTDALALIECLIKAQQTIISSIKIPTPNEIITGGENKLIT